MPKKFLRRHTKKLSKFNRKKKQKWRKPRGRDNKMRERRKGRPKVVSIGYKNEESKRKDYPLVKNIADLENLDKNTKAQMGRMGKKKRIELLNKAKEKNIEFVNFNSNKFLRKMKRKDKQKSMKKEKAEEKAKNDSNSKKKSKEKKK